MDIRLYLVRFKILITILRAVNIIFAFLPGFLYDKFDVFLETRFWGIWPLFWIAIFLLQLEFLKRYRIIGEIIINKKGILINNDSLNPIYFNSKQISNISLQYKGFEGDRQNYRNPFVVPLLSLKGLGSIRINRYGIIYKYKFLARQNYSKRLLELADHYNNQGIKFVVVFY